MEESPTEGEQQAEPLYKGTPVRDLVIDTIRWTPEVEEHVRTRSDDAPGETDIEPTWATEAALDPDRIVAVSPGKNEGTSSLKVVGRPISMPDPQLLKVWIWSDDPASGTWNAASACLANPTDIRRYKEEDEHDEA